MPDRLTETAVLHAFDRLGQLAAADGETIQLIVVGGVALMLGYHARQATHDVDALIVAPAAAHVRRWIATVAHEQQLASDWLNDGAKGFLTGTTHGVLLYQNQGIVIYRPSSPQLLAMKLSAWRHVSDVNDARVLLEALRSEGTTTYTAVWAAIAPYIPFMRGLKTRYALTELWQEVTGEAVD